MPGIAPVFSLPGDRMFQATEVVPGFQRPAIMHAYGGAKTGMERALALARDSGQTTNVGKCWAPPGRQYHH